MGENINDAAQTMTREQMLARAAEYMQEQQKQHPGTFYSSGWWAQALNLGADILEHLDQDTIEKLSASVEKVFDRRFAPQAMDEFVAEGRILLASHPNILEQYEAIFRDREAWRRMHKYTLAEAKRSKTNF